MFLARLVAWSRNLLRWLVEPRSSWLCAAAVAVALAVSLRPAATELEIRASGRVWGDVTTTAFVTDEGAFLRGQIRMEENVDLELETVEASPDQPAMESTPVPSPPQAPRRGAPADKPTGTSKDTGVG